MRRHVVACTVALLALLLGGAVKGDAARERTITRETEESLDETGRYVDMGIELRVVVRDVANGAPLIDGVPPVSVLRTHHLGGVVDMWGEGNEGKPYVCGPSATPALWDCSTDQEPLILHADTLPLWSLIQGSEGSGKTFTLAMWTAVRVLEHLGHDREIGLTVPTTKRMAHVRKAIRKLWPRAWYTWKERDLTYTFRGGPEGAGRTTVQLVSAHQPTEAEGSPIQGANWVACGSDELQDHFDKEGDILARGRSAPNARYKRLCTSTAKDSTTWRTFRSAVQAAANWSFAVVLGKASPFVHPDHWENLRTSGTMTLREYQRRVEARDMGPEAQVYHSFARTLDDGSPGSLRPIPLGAVDITAQELASFGPNIGLLLGHDPGKRQHVTEFLKAYRIPGPDARPRWFVVDEVTSADCIVHDHAQAVLKRAREKWRCNRLSSLGGREDGAQVLVRIDPHTRAEKSDHPGPDVYTTWRSLGMLVRAAAYKPNSNEPAVIPRLSRINMVNTLLRATSATEQPLRRLFIACDDKGTAAAPRLLAAFESMEKNAAGESEAEKKDANDLSHWPCAVGYALWQVERARLGTVAA